MNANGARRPVYGKVAPGRRQTISGTGTGTGTGPGGRGRAPHSVYKLVLQLGLGIFALGPAVGSSVGLSTTEVAGHEEGAFVALALQMQSKHTTGSVREYT